MKLRIIFERSRLYPTESRYIMTIEAQANRLQSTFSNEMRTFFKMDKFPYLLDMDDTNSPHQLSISNYYKSSTIRSMKKTLEDLKFKSIRIINERGHPVKIYWKMIPDHRYSEEVYSLLQKMKNQVQKDQQEKTFKDVQEPVL